jgi:protein TonB
MTYFRSITWRGNIHKRDERIGFISSLLIHVILFFIGGTIFVKTAQYNVQSVPQSTTVELVEAPQPPPVVEDVVPPKTIKKLVEVKKQEVVKIQRVSSQVIKVQANPNYFRNPPPEYPELAKQMRQEGLVMLTVDVDREGIPIKVEIKQSSGFRLLDQAAVKEVIHWKFQPGRIGDLPVESTVTVPIRYQLQTN